MTAPATKLRFEQVTKTFPLPAATADGTTRFAALARLSLEVRAGEILALVGPSGCGKSTLLDLAAGLTRPCSGAILIDGQPVQGPGPDRSVVFQQYALFPWLTALANVEFGLEAAGVARAHRRERARHFLALVGLAGFADRYPHQLSGGMKQRVAIARSLATDPQVLLMDEPFGALDAQVRELLQEELLRIWQETGKTIVFITHSIDEALVLGQRVAVMGARPGRITELIDIPFSFAERVGDLRSHPRFGALRHHVWSQLRHNAAAAA
ncbi:putative ATP-binding protein BAB2_1147 [Rhodovastum atsumiense]|uniref:ABC transporter ATP-binding protein n=1 Tax=Rhodovastum atsumiense TaxID=504468 RepID=A0A5M6IYU2_9PROT|nr:ABC transporter ATP-binding protein [Rhodovastum atsumiense]KAA5613524.1 ABC transporter ATP-binding protein [Rhodovastum atsumiense]CAH2603274.1 putative ATP-binding protein BAB2_1147 [Rhodovastum atsumiense]